MKLGAEARQKIRRRVESLLHELDSGLELVEILLDSPREHLGLVVQKEDRPMILRLGWIGYITMTDTEVKENFERQLHEKMQLWLPKTPSVP